jgi:hypothetical protein
MKTTTPLQQTRALDVMVRAALTNHESPLTSQIQEMLATLPVGPDERVATVLIMLAGMAVRDTARWKAILQDFLDNSGH